MRINKDGKRERQMYDLAADVISKGEYSGPTYACRYHKACLFCDNCDIVWDYTNGPYMFTCDAGKNCDEQEHNIYEDCDCFVDYEEVN